MLEGFCFELFRSQDKKLLFLSVLLCVYFIHACGVRIVSLELEVLAFASRHFSPRIVAPFALFSRIVFYPSLRASVVGGRSRPRSEAPCIS